ncbi:hypothetical protein Hte_007096 [Hypoxylon texense]
MGWYVFIAVVVYFPTLAIYRLWLHPLAAFPGPRLAAISRYYEAYYDVILAGQYTFKIAEMHRKYGPIVRISPYELHVSDPKFFDTLYSFDGQWEKYAWSVDAAGAPLSTICAVKHDVHKRRRNVVNHYFSKASVNSKQEIVQHIVDKLCERVGQYIGSYIPLGDAVSAFTRDVAGEFSLGDSYDNLDRDDFNVDLSKFSQNSGKFWRLGKHVRWFNSFMNLIPTSFIEKTSDSSVVAFFSYLKHLRRVVEGIVSDARQNPDSRRTVIHDILESNLPPVERTTSRIYDEVMTLMSAGYVSTAHAIRVILYHVYSDPQILMQVRSELRSAGENPDTERDSNGNISLSTLEKLPYLTAVLNEGLRLGPAIASRMARVAPDRDITYGRWRIPSGTPVGMTTILMHTDEEVFLDAGSFNPERWIDPKAPDKATRVFAPFSRGTRMCLGMHLAWAEFYFVVSTLVTTFDFQFTEVTAKHFRCISDEFVIGTKDLKGMKALVSEYRS